MKNVLLMLALGVSLSAGSLAGAEDANSEKVNAAVKSAQEWLQMVDENKFAESWAAAAVFFQSSIEQESWAEQLGKYRLPLGAVISRTVEATSYTTALPNAPQGEYVIILFKVDFANKKSAVETVTPMLDADGNWRVSGYFIK